MPSDVLDYVRAKDPAFEQVPDDDLIRYIGARKPEFFQDPSFKAEYDRTATEAMQRGLGVALQAGSTMEKTIPLVKDALSRPTPMEEDLANVQRASTHLTPAPSILESLNELATAGPSAYMAGARALAPGTMAASAETTQSQLGPAPDEKAMDVPMFPLSKVAQPLLDEKMTPDFVRNSPALSGVRKSLEQNINQLATPRNLTLLASGMGIAGLSVAAARAVSIGFAVMMGKQVPEIATQLGEEYAKPEAERDQTKIAKLISDGAIATGFTALAGLHGTGEPIQKAIGSVPTLTPSPVLRSLAPLTAKALEEIPTTIETPKETPGTGNVPVAERGPETPLVEAKGALAGEEIPASKPEPQTPVEERTPNAIQPESSQTVRSLRDQPIEGTGQVPAEVSSPKANEGGGKTPSGEGEVAPLPDATKFPVQYAEEVARRLKAKESAETPSDVAPKDPSEPSGEIIGMGGAVPGELQGGAGGDVYGIAERVREQRARAGQVDMPPRGEGISAPDSVDRGRQILAKDASAADKALTAFEADPKKAVSADGIAAVRAQGELLARIARRTEEKFGTDSPEYRAAWKNLSDWDARSKAMQTEWHKIGMAQQGETDIDTGTFTGLQRAFKESAGRDFNAGQAKKAADLAERVRKAEASAEEARQKLNDALKNQETVEPHIKLVAQKLKEYFSKRATSALDRIKARRAEGRLFTGIDPSEMVDYADYGASKILAKGIEGAEMTAEWAKEMVDEIGDYIKPHLNDIWEASKKAFEAGFRKTTGQSVEIAKSKAPKTPERAIWNKAKEYIQKGADDFDEVRNKVATDLGIPVDKVTDVLRSGTFVKRVSDEVWKKQQLARRATQEAKQWLIDAQTPAYKRWIQNIPRIMFGLKVGFHGTVALGTHAPVVAFQPRFWATYVRDFVKMYRMVGSTAYYERQVQDLLHRPNYITARRAGLVNDPYQYEDYNSPTIAKYLQGMTRMGNRGYAVLKILRQDMFDQMWNNLPKTTQIPDVAKAIADGVNHATGVVKMAAPKGSSLVLFAPRLEMSRVAWLATDPIRAADTFARWKDATEGEKQFAINQIKEKAWVAGTLFSLLAINQGILSATNSRQKINFTDPFRGDFLKFKAAGMQMSYGNPLITMARLPVRLWKIRQSDGGKLKNVIYPDEDSYTVLGEYARTQLSPFASLVTDLWFKSDWLRRTLPNSNRPMPKRLKAQGVKPYTWPEFWAEKALPIPAEEAIREVWGKGMGMSPEQIDEKLKALATLSIMLGTGARVNEDWTVTKEPTAPPKPPSE